MFNIGKMQAAGITLFLENGVLKFQGKKNLVEKWLPEVRENKSQIIMELTNFPQIPTQGVLLSSEGKHNTDSKINSPQGCNEGKLTNLEEAKLNALVLNLGNAVDSGRIAYLIGSKIMENLRLAEIAGDWVNFRAILDEAQKTILAGVDQIAPNLLGKGLKT